MEGVFDTSAHPLCGQIRGRLALLGEGPDSLVAEKLLPRFDDLVVAFLAGAGVNAPPAAYSVGGKEYIVVGAGGNTQIDFKRGNNIIAFTVD